MDNKLISKCEGHQHPTELAGTNEAIAAIVGTFLVLGSTGNIITMWVIIRNKSLHNPSNYFIFSLCVSDLISGLVCSPLWLYRRTFGFKEWKWGDKLCKFYWAADFATNYATGMHIVTFAFFRCYAVYQPFKVSLITKKKVIILISALWFIAVIVSSPLLFFMGVVKGREKQIDGTHWPSCSIYNDESLSSNESNSKAGSGCCVNLYNTYMLVVSTIFFYVPQLCVITLSCFIVRAILRKQRWRRQTISMCTTSKKQLEKRQASHADIMDAVNKAEVEISDVINKDTEKSFHHTSQDVTANLARNVSPRSMAKANVCHRGHNERRIFTQLSFIVVVFMIGYLPVTIYLVWTTATSSSNLACGDTDYWFGVVSYLCLRLSECMNPIMYNLGSKSIWMATKNLFQHGSFRYCSHLCCAA